MRLASAWAALAFACSLTGAAGAQDAPHPGAAAITLPAGTIVEVELTEALSSRTSQIGDRFALRLAAPILIDGREIVPAGAPGAGEVIDADSSGFGGRQGKLIISGRYLEIGGQRVRIRGMQITGVGRDRSTGAIALSTIPYAGLGAIFIHGGEIELPVGASGVARTATDVEVAPMAVSAEETAAAETLEELNLEELNEGGLE